MTLDVRMDADLVAAARDGDHGAWAALCQRHAPVLAAYLGARLRRPALVEDFVAETVHAAWRHLHEIDDGQRFAAWFRRLGAGIALRWAREHPEASIEEPFPGVRLEGLAAADQAAVRALDLAIGGLPETERMAIELRWRGGLDDAALGQALRCTADEARQLLERAERSLEQAMGAA